MVVVKKGLKAGERVVSNGSLILSQMFEDQSTVDTGLPAPVSPARPARPDRLSGGLGV